MVNARYAGQHTATLLAHHADRVALGDGELHIVHPDAVFRVTRIHRDSPMKKGFY
jgi:hypothetical protein